MSKFIDEIVQDIKTNPQEWVRFGNDGLQKDNVTISCCGNGSRFFLFWLTSVVEVTINEKRTWGSLSWADKYRIEQAFIWWMSNASLKMVSV